MISLHCLVSSGVFHRFGGADRWDLSPDLKSLFVVVGGHAWSGQRPYEKPHGLTFRSFGVHSQGERMGGKTLSEKRILPKSIVCRANGAREERAAG